MNRNKTVKNNKNMKKDKYCGLKSAVFEKIIRSIFIHLHIKICSILTIFDKIPKKNKFNSKNEFGLLTSVDLHKCDPKIIRDAEKIREFVKKLCNLIKMKRFGKTTVVFFGKNKKVKGYSMTQLIETSLISGHFANSSNNAYIDIFSCKSYDSKKAAEFTKKFFKAEYIKCSTFVRK